MRELRIKTGHRHIAVFDLPAAIGRKEAVQEIGDQIDALIAFLDDLGGDPDLEDAELGMRHIDDRGRLLPGAYTPAAHDEDREPDEDDKGDQSWPEWHTLPARDQKAGNTYGSLLPNMPYRHEDDEEDDAAEDDDMDYCLAGDDRVVGGSVPDPGLMMAASGPGDGVDGEPDGPASWQPRADNDD